MRILIIGSGGREHVLAETYAKSKKTDKVFVAPGNDFMNFANEKIICLSHVAIMDFDGIVKVCKKEKIGLVDVAQDDVLAAGFVDKFQKLGIHAFGPTQKAAELEWNKKWAREFMMKYQLPIPKFKSFNDINKAIKFIDSVYLRHSGEDSERSVEDDSRISKTIGDSGPSNSAGRQARMTGKHGDEKQLLFIKASGLALGKGVIRAENRQQAIQAIDVMKQFGKSGETFLIEEGLLGEEFSLFVICDSDNYIIAKSAQDHKTIYNADQGPNTGGVGCVSPTNALSSSSLRIIENKIIKPLLKGMQKEKRPYQGILYLGGMLTKDGVKIIEFNARWGDPEAEVILPSIKTDYLTIIESVLNKQLNKLTINFDDKIRLSIAGCSMGYPNDYSQVKGKEIFGLLDAMKLNGVTIYGSGIKRQGKKFYANGGRIFHLVAEGSTIQEARRRAYQAMSMIYIEGNNLHYRTDIGWRELERLYS